MGKMMTKTISNCNECCHFEKNIRIAPHETLYKYQDWCNAIDRMVGDEGGIAIPEWCPLPDS